MLRKTLRCHLYTCKLAPMLELWAMLCSTPSLPLLPGPLGSEVVVLDRALSMDQIELNCVPMLK